MGADPVPDVEVPPAWERCRRLGRRARGCRPRPRTPVPGPGDRGRAAGRVGSSRLEGGGKAIQEVVVERVEAAPDDRGSRGRRPPATRGGRRRPGAGAGNATWTNAASATSRVSPRAVGDGRGRRMSVTSASSGVGSDSIHSRGTLGVHFRRILEHEQGRGDRARSRAGCAPRHARRGDEHGIERGPVVEDHRRHDISKVGLTTERLRDAPDARLPQAWRAGHEGAGARRHSGARRWRARRGHRRAGGTGRAAWSWAHLRWDPSVAGPGPVPASAEW